MAIVTGQVFKDCMVVGDIDFAWFLQHPEDYEELVFYDIVMPKEGKTDNIKYQNIKTGDKLNIEVNCIQIADDGIPGLFVYIA